MIIQIWSNIFPKYFAKKFYSKLLNPQIRKNREYELATLEKAVKSTVLVNSNEIQLYRWGESENKILLVHGWEGQAANYSEIIEKLLIENYTIYSFDGPGHGKSKGGNNIMFEYRDSVKFIIEKLNINQIVSHSFGSVVTTYALSQLPNHKIKRYVLLTTPWTFKSYVYNISSKIGIGRKSINKFIKIIEEEKNEKIEDMDVAKYVKNANIEKALIIHDINDKVIPISDAEEVVKRWDKAVLHKIENTGHFRILRTPEVTDKIIEFIEN